MSRFLRLAAPTCALILSMIVVFNPGSYLNSVLAQAASFLETFDGTPAVPTDYTNPHNWDILVSGVNDREPSLAQHGPHCEAPGFPYTSANTHPLTSAADAVFICNNHLMTSPGITGYGAIYMTPPALLDYSGGTAVLTWDLSTLRTASRDWIGVVLTPYSEHQVLAYNNIDNHVPPDNVHIMLGGCCGGTNIFEVSERVGGGADVLLPSDTFTTWDMVLNAQNPPLAEDAARRDTLEVDLSATHVRVCITGNNTGATYTYRGHKGFCWVDTDLPTPLDRNVWSNQASVQFAHHVYNAEKSCSADEDQFSIVHNVLGDLLCPPNTWHWDNVRITPAVPYSIIKPITDYQLTSPSPQTVTFPIGAPPNTNLEFVSFGTQSQLQVSFDNGASWQPAHFQPALATGHDEGGEMVWMPIPTGVSSIQVRGANGFWGGYTSYGFTMVSATAGVVLPPAVPSPTPTATAPTGSSTSTPTPTSVLRSNPTSTPTATPISTRPPTLTPRPTSGGQGSGSSLALSGAGAYAEAPATPRSKLDLTGDWTVEAWFKDSDANGFDHEFHTLLNKGDGTAGEAPYFVLVGNGSIIAGLRSGGTNYRVTYDLKQAQIDARQWQHVAASFRASSRKLTLYLNGEEVADGTLAAGPARANGLPLEIGRHGPSTGKYWVGNIDDVRIWKAVRSAGDIQANYRRELTNGVADLVANWRFDERSGRSAVELVSPAASASLLGPAAFSADVHP